MLLLPSSSTSNVFAFSAEASESKGGCEDVEEGDNCIKMQMELMDGGCVGGGLQVRRGANEQGILEHVHGVFNDIGVTDLTVQIEVKAA